MTFFTAERVESIASATRPPYDVLVYVLAYAGLRFGEAAALRRNDCELDRTRLRVNESLAEVNGQLFFGATKTHQRRFVVLPQFLVALLQRHLDEHVAAHEQSLVFTSPDGQPLRYGNFARRFWKRSLEHAGLAPSGLHALRHRCASLLITHGAPINAVQAQLGHRSAELTLDRYGHLYPDQMDLLATRLEDARAQARATHAERQRSAAGTQEYDGSVPATAADRGRATASDSRCKKPHFTGRKGTPRA